MNLLLLSYNAIILGGYNMLLELSALATLLYK